MASGEGNASSVKSAKDLATPPTSFLRHLDTVLSGLLGGLLPEERRFWILVPVTGLVAGCFAVTFDKLIELVRLYTWGDPGNILGPARRLIETAPWWVVLIPTLGGIVAALGYLIPRSKDQLQGTGAMLDALAFKKGRLPLLTTLADSFVAMTAVATGASLGREGPMIHSGAALGSWLGDKLRLEDHHVRILLACGAAGGISAAYNVPIGGSIFAMEVLLGSFALDLFGPIIISSVIATTVSRLFQADPAYVIPEYRLVTEWELLLDLLLGVGMGFVSVVFIRVFSGFGALFRWLEPLRHMKPILAMAILGVIGLRFPELFGNGYETVNSVLNWERSPPIGLLLLLPALKIIATALCRSGGVPGGLFTPSLFVGALLGGAFGAGLERFFVPGSISGPGAYALIGMGAILAGTIQAPVTAILMIFEMTQDYSIILRLMSACMASALVSHMFLGGSLYTEPLRRRGILLPSALMPTWLRQPSVRSVLNTNAPTISPADPFDKVVESFLLAPEGHDKLYVTSREGKYLGTVSLHDIKRFFRETDYLESVIAADVLDSNAPFVYADDPASRALEVLAEYDSERIPVLDNTESRQLLGTVSKRTLLSSYAESNLARRLEKKPIEPAKRE